MSSFESISATLDPKHWSLHGGAPKDDCSAKDVTNGFWHDCTGGNVMAERNYPCDNQIMTYYGNDAHGRLDDVGEGAFKKQLYELFSLTAPYRAMGEKSTLCAW